MCPESVPQDSFHDLLAASTALEPVAPVLPDVLPKCAEEPPEPTHEDDGLSLGGLLDLDMEDVEGLDNSALEQKLQHSLAGVSRWKIATFTFFFDLVPAPSTMYTKIPMCQFYVNVSILAIF